MHDSEKSHKTVQVEASADVSVTSFNYKMFTADTSVIYPTTEWGKEYFIFTPPSGPKGSRKEFAVTNGKDKNQVEIFPEASINFKGHIFRKGYKFVIDLEPYESVQLQSNGDLSGSRVSAQHPVAVFSGHTCTSLFSKCNHVYEQLLPVSSWGTSFILPGLSFQKTYDSVYMQASQATQVSINNVKPQHGTCWAMGDPHYRTFDGRRFDFMGTCTYVIAKNCGKNSSLPAFEVLAKNENRGSLKVSYTGLVMVKVYDITIMVVRSERGRVRIDNSLWSLPIVLNNGKLNLFQCGRSAVIETDFGLSVRYDWDHNLVVTLSNSFAGKTCGLCGNFNDSPADDFTTPSGTQATLEAYTEACQDAGIQVQDWRKMAKCPAKCPAYSHYELCGNACPATCSDPTAPSKCKRPCVETCTCNNGFVLSGDKCVPADKCGCTYEGHYVPAGETFWADQRCTRWCKCVPGSRRVECQDKGCGAGQQCKLMNGIRKCQALSYSTCHAIGDPHYLTFDKMRFDFQGTCVYQLVALCSNDPELVPFEVLVQNDHRGSKVVSYTKLVQIKVYSTSIVLTKTHKGLIMVNDELVNLPINLNEGQIFMHKSGLYAVVTTDFGLKVTFDWKSSVFVTLPSNYMGAVCGLCGNYNGKHQDDLIPKDGNKPVTPAAFGSSWKVAEIPGCVEGCKGVCPTCDITEKIQYEKKDFCGLIRDPKGPFRECHAKVDPAEYLEDCVYDVCLYKGRKDVLCQAITSYTSACQKVGAKVYSWRTSQFCAMKCPINSHYEICATACPATCGSLAPPQGCEDFCGEGCPCDENYILSGDLCVPSSQCGCIHNDRYYKIGEVFYPSGLCQDECKCTQDGEVECKKFACGPNEKCKIQNGVQKCHPFGKGVCRASGDPHYLSFDGRKFDFQGTCTYTLSKSCGVEGTHLEAFSVQVENVQWDRMRGKKKVSVSRLVAVKVYGFTLIMRNKMFGVLVNGEFNNLPVNLKDGAVKVYQEGRNYVIATNFELVVTYDLVYLVTVTVPGNYRGKVCGLCGNFNGDKNDDFQMSNHQLTNNVNMFGKSWKITIPNVVCENGCEGNTCPNCDAAHKAIFSKPTYCGIIAAPKGPFVACHSKIDPQLYFDDCVFDLCASNGEGNVLCDSIAAYAYNCHLAGVDVKNWRTPAFCPMKCFSNSHYEVCAETCSASCPGLTEIVECPTSYPCKDANCRVQEACRVEKGEAVCVPKFTGTCWAWGDPHYHTFDGYNFDFQGTCKYVVSKTCGTLDGLVPFSVTERNDNRGNTAVSYVREVDVVVYGYTITIRKNQVGQIMLGDGEVSVFQRGKTAEIKTDFGLLVTYDWNWHLVIKLPSSYYGSVCGLCGNFNGNRGDELQNPTGQTVSSVIEWGKSWQTPDQDKDYPCWDTCEKNCPTCDDNDKKLYQTQGFCGALTAKTNNMFQKCNGKLDPQAFMNSCVYDMCLNKGDKKMLCQALDSYNQQCRENGIIIKNWRKTFGCPMNCQKHSHYEDCASPCQPSCPFPEEKQMCSGACVEACVCDKGYVLSAGVCVPVKTCGCSYQGRYFKPGQQFWADETCGRLCTCDITLGMVTCHEASCSSNEKCTVIDGVRACRPISYALCTASGDPHYRTFDGRKYDFQGTCEYQLAELCSQQAGLVPFNVTVQNDNRGSKAVSYTKTVKISIHGATLIISREYPYKVLLNGHLASLPLDYNNELTVFQSGRTTVVETVAGITVTFDCRSRVTISLPSTYQGTVCGLCGNYNSKAQDDLAMPNGQTAPDGTRLGESWQVGLTPGCSSICQGPWCQVCSDSQRKVYQATKYCGIIADKAGPFRECHSHVDPAPYMEDCVYDVCQYHGHQGSVCDAVEVRCAEACECDQGYLLSGETCVPVRECGCSYDGQYYKKGEVFYPEDKCMEKCTCGDNGAVTCQKEKCRLGEVCKLLNGVKGCHPEGEKKCVASGDPHYISFDGRRFDFQGTCIYVLAKVCDDDKGQLTPFTVTQGNEKYGNGKVAVTNSVTVTVYGYVIHIQQRLPWKVIVNEELLNLPLSLEEGSLMVTQEGRNIVIRTAFGLKVFYDTVYYVEVVVPSTYQGRMCGLCGNYNNNGRDDFKLPDGKQTNNIDNFGEAWVVDLPGYVCGGCGGQCPSCEPAKAAVYGKTDSCGIISAPNGPFKACHSKIDPASYVSNCVFDVCATDGNKDTLCNSIQAYALACQGAGIQVLPWRSNSFCPPSCPPHSHYEVCANTCKETCASILQQVTCSERCFEGCQCDAGFVSDGIQCVPLDNCGCMHNNKYLTVGQAVVDKNCSSKCECQASGLVTCEKMFCTSGEVCDVRDGVRGCHVIQGHCIISPVGDLSSFDGMSAKIGSQGAFELVSLCDETSNQWFRVVVDVRLCRKRAPLTVATLYVFFKDTTVAVNSEHVVWVNGRKVSLPSKVTNELSVQISNRSVVIKRTSSVQVIYSISQKVIVTVDGNLSGKICGACGNYNNNSQDDMKTADGKITSDFSAVIWSWSAEDFSRW
ncbi:IgGFc-binding protein [Anableps anableps]